MGVEQLSGVNVKGYLLEECLGHSSHTAVYRATASSGAEWAVKVVDSQLEPESGLMERLRREAGLLSHVDHPDILPIHEAGRADTLTFAASPLLRAPSLQDLIAGGNLDQELAWKVLNQIADALDSVHYRGLVFRVLKPINILVDDQQRIHLAEFGVSSRRVGPLAMSTPGYQLALPQYLAPEQVEGREPDWRADIYAMAVLIFEILTGTPLYGSAPLSETLKATLHTPAPSAHARKPSLPPAIDRVLGRALAKDPRERHRSVWELLDELVGLPDENGASGVSPPTLGSTPGRPPSVSSGGFSSTTAAPPLAPPPESAVALLQRMGVPALEVKQTAFLNSFFAAMMRFAKEVSHQRWPDLLRAAGLTTYLDQDPPDDGSRTASVEAPSRLAEAFELVFGPEASDLERQWGRLTIDHWMRTTQQRPFRMMGKPEQKVADTLYVFTRSMDRVRGEPLHAWKQVDKRQFWLVHYGNLMVLGRRKQAKACRFWTAGLESALRWGGLANDWVAEETECGCVTGTYTCVFTIESVRR